MVVVQALGHVQVRGRIVHHGIQQSLEMGAGWFVRANVFSRDDEVESLDGRFEVTRAQWATFRGPPTFAAGTENHPVSGIEAKAARAYCRWLTQRTGRKWRLPTKAEWKRLAKHVGKTDNTLDRWAGYAPSPADAVTLAAEVSALGLDRVLYPVGTFSPTVVHGDAPRPGDSPKLFFDVGGNVAEWVQDGETILAIGGAACLTKDGRRRRVDPPAAFIGLRVACER